MTAMVTITMSATLRLEVIGRVKAALLGFLHEYLARDDLVLELALHLGRDRAARFGQLRGQHVHAGLGHRLAVDDGEVLRESGQGEAEDDGRQRRQQKWLHGEFR